MPHIEGLKVKNYRALKNVELKDVQPLTVVLGPNGCGKSTLFDVFGFLADCLQSDVRRALESRGRIQDVRSRGSSGPISFELRYRESDFGEKDTRVITYFLAIDEENGKPIVVEESLRWRRGSTGNTFKFLDMIRGRGEVITGEVPEKDDERTPVILDNPGSLAIKVLGQLADNPRVASLRRFIEGWFLSYFVPDQARQIPEAGVMQHLSRTGDNLPNVVQYLSEEHPDTLDQILSRIAERIPNLESVTTQTTIDGRLVLQFKDGPFKDPFLARDASDGTIKMFAYLILLNDPNPSPFVGVEEPENGLHPKLLNILAQEFRVHARGGRGKPATQVFVTSHSPFFINSLKAKELWILERGKDGYTNINRADEVEGVPEFLETGAALGDLWYEDFFGGNP